MVILVLRIIFQTHHPQAVSEYIKELSDDGLKDEEKEQLRQNMLSYCERDTLATVRILDFLEKNGR